MTSRSSTSRSAASTPARGCRGCWWSTRKMAASPTRSTPASMSRVRPCSARSTRIRCWRATRCCARCGRSSRIRTRSSPSAARSGSPTAARSMAGASCRWPCRETFSALFQTVEYLRAFLVARLAWSRLNALIIISGAFGLFRRLQVIEVGGYTRGTVGEDMELVVKLHRLMRDKRTAEYRIAFVPEPVCWTEVPEDLRGPGPTAVALAPRRARNEIRTTPGHVGQGPVRPGGRGRLWQHSCWWM